MIALTGLAFPPSMDLASMPPTPPAMAPLSQQVVFFFSGTVGNVTQDSIYIYAEPGADYTGPLAALDPAKELLRARGTLTADGDRVIFTPFLPNLPVDLSPAADLDAVPGLLPGFDYHIVVPVGTTASISNLENIAPGVNLPVTFHTGAVENLYFGNVPPRGPRVLDADPPDGTLDLPVRLLSGKVLPGGTDAIHLHFDLPLSPAEENLSGRDVTGDGHPDPSFFFRYADPRLPVVFLASPAPLYGWVDANTGAAEIHGPFFGAADTVRRMAESPHGILTALAEPNLLVTVNRETGETLDPRTLDLQAGESLEGLAYGPDNGLYLVVRETPTGNRLLRVDPDTGETLESTELALPSGESMVDLAFVWDGALLGLVKGKGAPGAPWSEVKRVDPSSGQVIPLAGPFPLDLESMVTRGMKELLLFEGEGGALVRIDLALPDAFSMGPYVGLPPGAENLDFAQRFYDLGTEVNLEKNGPEGAFLTVRAAGPLPFGVEVTLLERRNLENLGGFSLGDELGGVEAGCIQLARYVTYDPGPKVIEDRILEPFVDNLREGAEEAPSYPPATWNVQDVDPAPPEVAHLLAARGEGGTGELGDFLPDPAFPEIFLNTDYQVLPLATGGTPGVKKMMVVKGGIFNFRNIHIPEGVTIVARGSHPLVLNATEKITVEGTIDVSGMPGLDEISFDSAFIPTAGGIGGAGGGRGGMSQPPFPEDFTALVQLKSSPTGETGLGPQGLQHIGGKGGESGAKGPDIIWKNYDPDSRGSGGGGGLLSASYVSKYGAENSRGHDGLGFWGVDPLTGEYVEKGHDPYGGDAGVAPFKDAKQANDFMGPGGEIPFSGGSGGGGGGSRLDSLNPEAQQAAKKFKNPAMPACMYDSKGGGGGGGGGCVILRGLQEIVVGKTARILARGGKGGGGERVGEGGQGGGGGGGAGGAVILESGERIVLEGDGQEGAVLDVSGGQGADCKETGALPPPYPGDYCKGWKKGWQWCSFSTGDGGQGSFGLIQLMVPDPDQNLEIQDGVSYTAVVMVPSETQFSKRGFPKMDFFWDPDCLVDPHLTVSHMSSISYAVSRFIDLGSSVLRPPVGGLLPPLFEPFRGTDGEGYVETVQGWVKNYQKEGYNDIVVDAPDLGLHDYIPEGINTVKVEFQGAGAVAPGSAIPDLDTLTPWSPDPAVAAGMRFIRFRIILDTAVGGDPTPESPRPQVDYLRIRLRY